MKQIVVDHRSKILYLVMVGIIALSIMLTFYRFVVLRDFETAELDNTIIEL